MNKYAVIKFNYKTCIPCFEKGLLRVQWVKHLLCLKPTQIHSPLPHMISQTHQECSLSTKRKSKKMKRERTNLQLYIYFKSRNKTSKLINISLIFWFPLCSSSKQTDIIIKGLSGNNESNSQRQEEKIQNNPNQNVQESKAYQQFILFQLNSSFQHSDSQKPY